MLRRALLDASKRFGLIVVGYSGRDEFIMETLNEAVNAEGAFPAGLFWLHRGESAPMESVGELLSGASGKGIDGGLVRIANFDETMRDIIRLCQGLDTQALDNFSAERRRWTAAPAISGGKNWPVVRLNGLELTHLPSHCRRIVCKIGNTSEVRDAIVAARVEGIVARTSAGVLAYGSDDDLRTAFQRYGITEFDLHSIEMRRLRYEFGERGLLREALSVALARGMAMTVNRRRGGDLLAPAKPEDAAWDGLRELVGSVAGTVKNSRELRWREGVGLSLDWADDRPWVNRATDRIRWFDRGQSQHGDGLCARTDRQTL